MHQLKVPVPPKLAARIRRLAAATREERRRCDGTRYTATATTGAIAAAAISEWLRAL